MIAPESTTKHTDVLLRFSRGAFVPGRPVLPVLFRYPSQHFNVGWGITYNALHMLRLTSQFVNYLEVSAGRRGTSLWACGP
jgi:lysophosphatidylcholine acyltransferase / lyso-PAF acetyltransferase